MPFTLIPVMFNLQHNQGVLCLWKGVFGGVGLTCMYMVLDKLLSDFTGLPRELVRMKKSKTLIEEFFPDLFAAFTSYLLADAVLYPAETVLHRLYIQGILGFYRGFGALILQYLLHFAVLHMLRVVLEQLENSFNKDVPPVPKRHPTPDPLFSPPSSLSSS
ncbi:unnamed protein product [Soboliphyme baturini]|uniref:Solute carrier family 25 member 46 n=1 Tax=Soboliphyme baturini TaxID=241478 RepID=A0A183J2E4_9BILA|nr:unnamed protein product [Soboliphyme baturini]